jgi:acetylornithine deacetylase/succinyl-diaminopimelate desuccinylase-like protein
MRSAAESLATLLKQPEVCATLEWFRKERTWITEQHLALCRIPAPTFFEQQRAEWMVERFKSVGWEAKPDRAGNVIAMLPGRRERSPVAVTAHLDTVLAPRNPDDIRVTGDGRILGPGVSDNGAGLTALLALAAAWKACEPLTDTASSPALIANVGEEGEGNLCGMRYLCRGSQGSRSRACLVLDGPTVEHVTCRALASRRFEVTLTGAGGHSWNDHGVANPVHTLSRAITWFTEQAQDLERQSGEPRSSFNFGILQGGTSINSIPVEARAKVDLRSERQDRMDLLADLLMATVEKAVAYENSRSSELRTEMKGSGRVAARVKEIGSRPGGGLADGEPLLAYLLAINAHLGIRSQLDCSSTDANIPLSLGLPAVSIGAGGQGGGAHTPSEWYSPEGREVGLRRMFLAVCLLSLAEEKTPVETFSRIPRLSHQET